MRFIFCITKVIACDWIEVDSSWNVMAQGDAREGKWRANWRMEWTASTLHTTSEHGVSGTTTADALTSAASSRLNWRPRRFKWTRPFRRKTKSDFCSCAITFQLASTMKCNSTLQFCIFLIFLVMIGAFRHVAAVFLSLTWSTWDSSFCRMVREGKCHVCVHIYMPILYRCVLSVYL